jgi:hypothetical protein
MGSRERLGYVNLLTGQQVDDAIRPSAADTMPGGSANKVSAPDFSIHGGIYE